VAARVTYQVTPTAADPEGTRFRTATKFEGTVGQILDDALAELRKELRIATVTGADGHVYDRPEVPQEAVRELLSNALVHRSFAPGQDSASPMVAVHPDHVIVVSPGGIHVDVDPRDLGHPSVLNTPRNLTLTRICELLTTPSGARITEAQASGIRVADRACHAADSAPAIFGSRPARFSAALLRGSLNTQAVRERWAARGVDLTEPQARITAFAERLESFLSEDPTSDFKQVRLDTRLAARLFERMEPERAAIDLAALESYGILNSRRMADRLVWELKETPDQGVWAEPQTQPTTTRRPRVNRTAQITALLAAVNAATEKSIRLHEAMTVLGVSRATASQVIELAVKKDLIEPTSDDVHSPQRGYRLTRSGAETVRRGRA
jgi:ATP-dependent DNA helicase RecG